MNDIIAAGTEIQLMAFVYLWMFAVENRSVSTVLISKVARAGSNCQALSPMFPDWASGVIVRLDL
jgi:hypothetical protein